MSKISRADSKARFRTGMYPTQADFENLHDSYVHKDDTIPLEQVGTNGATVVSLLNQKANSSHTHEIADVNGLQAFITKVNTFLGTVDASDDTINRWKEIEAFLQGITDTENLTGLLAALKSEIEGNLSIDATLSSTSEHALQNKVLYDELRVTENSSSQPTVLTVNGTSYPIETIDANSFNVVATSGSGTKIYAFPTLDPNKAYRVINDEPFAMDSEGIGLGENKTLVTTTPGTFILKFEGINDGECVNISDFNDGFGFSSIAHYVGDDWVSIPFVGEASNNGQTYYGDNEDEMTVLNATETGSGSTPTVKSLKQKIAELEARLAAVPSNYIEFATDMSAYASAPTGKIVAYFGTTTNDFRRGLFYEKTASGWQNIPVSPVIQ